MRSENYTVKKCDERENANARGIMSCSCLPLTPPDGRASIEDVRLAPCIGSIALRTSMQYAWRPASATDVPKLNPKLFGPRCWSLQCRCSA